MDLQYEDLDLDLDSGGKDLDLDLDLNFEDLTTSLVIGAYSNPGCTKIFAHLEINLTENM